MAIKIGDIFEIPTKRGLAYGQITHSDKKYGDVIRILDVFASQRPHDFSEIALKKERFIMMFPLKEAVRAGIFDIVAHTTIPEFARAFPVFRSGIEDPATGKVAVWWFWDGTKSWKVGQISKEQRKYPLKELWNDTRLIERIETDWTPESDPS